MKLSLLKKKEIKTVPSVIWVNRLVWHENAITLVWMIQLEWFQFIRKVDA